MYSHSPLLCAVWRNAEMFPDKAAFIVDGVETSYSSLVVNVRKAAGMLVEKGPVTVSFFPRIRISGLFMSIWLLTYWE